MNVPFRSLLKPTAWLLIFPFPPMMLFLTFTALVLPPWLSMPPTLPLGRLPLIVLLVTFTVTVFALAMKMMSLVLPLLLLLVMINVIAMPYPAGALLRAKIHMLPLPMIVVLGTI